MGKEQLLIPRSGSGEETPKVRLPYLSAGQTWKPFIGFIICSNISSFYYVNYIHTYKTIAYLQIFLCTKKAPKSQALSITGFFANTISLVKSVFLLFAPIFIKTCFQTPPKVNQPSLFTRLYVSQFLSFNFWNLFLWLFSFSLLLTKSHRVLQLQFQS